MDDLKAQRNKRLDEIKLTFMTAMKKYHPDIEGVAFHPDFEIDLFEQGLLDAPEEKYQEFLNALATAPPPEPLEEE